MRVFHDKSIAQECPEQFSTRVSYKSVTQECQSLAVCFRVRVCIRVRGFHLVLFDNLNPPKFKIF